MLKLVNLNPILYSQVDTDTIMLFVRFYPTYYNFIRKYSRNINKEILRSSTVFFDFKHYFEERTHI